VNENENSSDEGYRVGFSFYMRAMSKIPWE